MKNVLAISILSIVLGCSVAFNIFQRQTIGDIKSTSESLKTTLNEVSAEKDSALLANYVINVELAQYKHDMDSVNVLLKYNNKQIYRLSKALNTKLKEAEKLSADEKHDAIKDNYSDMWDMQVSEEYSFTDAEVANIYDDVIRANYLDSIRHQQEDMINNMRYQLKLTDGTLANLEEDNAMKQRLIEELYNRLARLEEQNMLSEADNRHLKKQLNNWRIGSIGAGSLLLLIALL